MIKIIIAGDCDPFREGLREFLTSEPDMEAEAVPGLGVKLSNALEKEIFDIILISAFNKSRDLVLSKAEWIHNLFPEMKIIFLTARDFCDIIIGAAEVGAAGCLVCGCSESDILKNIREAYAGRPVLDARAYKKLLEEFSRLRQSERSLLYFIEKFSNFTSAERDLIRLLLAGKKISEMAAIRTVEVVTIKTQIKSLLKKFSCSRSKEIVKIINDLNIAHLF